MACFLVQSPTCCPTACPYPKINKAPSRLLLQDSTQLLRESRPCYRATMNFFTVMLFASLAITSFAVLPGEYAFFPTPFCPLQATGLQMSNITTLMERDKMYNKIVTAGSKHENIYPLSPATQKAKAWFRGQIRPTTKQTVAQQRLCEILTPEADST